MTYDEYIKNPNICKNCGKPILPKEGQKISNVKQKQFCSSSCAATYNNKKYPKRKKEKIYSCKTVGKNLIIDKNHIVIVNVNQYINITNI